MGSRFSGEVFCSTFNLRIDQSPQPVLTKGTTICSLMDFGQKTGSRWFPGWLMQSLQKHSVHYRATRFLNHWKRATQLPNHW